jgi:hybrid cluster-associated redox disulfide protein
VEGMMTTIDGKTRVHDLLSRHPKAAKVLDRHGMFCRGCRGSENETLHHAAQNHGLALDTLLEEIKDAVKTGS